jgi:hypothetical protein
MTAPSLGRFVTIPPMEPGTRVEVRSRFDASWARGFEIHEVIEGPGAPSYRIRRRSDAAVLPVLFDAQDVREERRKRDSMWWV